MNHLQDRLQKAALVLVLLAAAPFVTTGCATTNSNSKVVQKADPTRKQTKRRVSRITKLRDPLVRDEIHAELEDLKSLSDARQALRERFTTEPLKGPLTMARLEDTLIAEYRANALQKAYQAANKETIPPTNASRPNAPLQPTVIAQIGKIDKAERSAKAEKTDKQNRTAKSKPRAEVPPPQQNVPALLSGGEARALSKSNSHHDQPAPAMMPGIPTYPIQAQIPGTVSGLPPSALAPLAEPGSALSPQAEPPITVLKKLSALENSAVELSPSSETPLIFDIPVTYNARVSFWIRYFQTSGRVSFRSWLERSSRFLPLIQYELTRAGLPQDLVYVAMIESGFSPTAVSHASAMGLWQFIAPTGRRYGLKIDWWVDERKDFLKSTRAAIGYMTDLYRQFNSWYLVAASYNMGENGVRRLIKKHGTNNFWELADKGALPNETKNYVPKILAAMLISKAPALYGFRDLEYQMPMSFEYFQVPAGTDLVNLARYLGVSEKYLKELNPELIRGFVPRHVSGHKIRIPKGSMMTVSQYVRMTADNETMKQ